MTHDSQTLGSSGAPVTLTATQTLSVSNPSVPLLSSSGTIVSLPQAAGDPIPIPGNNTPPARGAAVFTQTGANNFVNNDTMNIAGTVYKFTSPVLSGAHSVLIGQDFWTTATHLVAAVNNTAGQNSIYAPSSVSGSTTSICANPFVTAAYDPVPA